MTKAEIIQIIIGTIGLMIAAWPYMCQGWRKVKSSVTNRVKRSRKK